MKKAILIAAIVTLLVPATALAGGDCGNDSKQNHPSYNDHGDKDNHGDKGRGDDRDHGNKGNNDHGHKGGPPPKPQPGSQSSAPTAVATPGASFHCDGNNVVVVGAGVLTNLPFAKFMFGDLTGPQPAQAPIGKTPMGSFTCSPPPNCVAIIGHDGQQMISDTMGDLFDVTLFGPKGNNGETIGSPACSKTPLNFDPPGWHA